MELCTQLPLVKNRHGNNQLVHEQFEYQITIVIYFVKVFTYYLSSVFDSL